MSVVLRFGRNPHWASGKFSYEMLVVSQDLPRDAPVVAAVSLTAPVLEQGDDCGIPEFFWHILFFPNAGDEWNASRATEPADLKVSAGIPSIPGDCPELVCLIAFETSSIVGGRSRLVITGFYRI